MTEANGGSAPTQDEVTTLLRKAEKGDTTVLPALRTWMDRTPGYWEEVGDLANTARESLIRALSGDKNLVVQEAHARKCTALTAELAGPQPSPLERLLVERIVLCWLHLHYDEALYVQHLDKLTLRQDEFFQQRIS